MRRGSTLLETLVALAIAALVLTAVYGAVTRAAEARERGTRRAERLATSRTLLLRIAGEIEGALAAPERFVVAPPPDEGPPWSALRFATFAGGPRTPGDVSLVAYRVEPTGTTAALVRRSATRFAPADAPEPPGLAVLEGVTAFRVRCFDGDAWTPAWRAPGLPRAVEVVIDIDDGTGGVEELATTVTLPGGGA